MATPVYKFLTIICFYFLSGSLQATGQMLSSAVFIAELKNSEAKVILKDGSVCNSKQVMLTRRWNGSLCQLSISNISAYPLTLNEVVIFDFLHHLPSGTPIYGEGFQMLAQTGGTLEHPVNLGTFSDREHYGIPEPEKMRTVYGMLTLQPADMERILLATTSCNRFISRFSFDAKRLRISLDCENLVIKPGETWKMEEFIAVADPNRERLYDKLSSAIARHHPALKHKSVPVGWCSWYTYGSKVTAADVSANTNWIAGNMPTLKYIQIDDGYQPWMGDWMEAGGAFGGDVSAVLKEIRSKNLQPAIWVAPFIASPASKLFKEHPDWMVKDENGQPMPSNKVGFGGWRQGPWYVLDGTHPQVQKYFTKLFKTMREEWGCTYFKLDANYWGAIHGGVHYDKNATRIEAYRRGMQAIRKGAGDAFLLGCNHPIWASLGTIHGSRSSMDISRTWKSFKGVGKENLLRGWQNGRLWWNDPDCLVLIEKVKGGIMDQGGNVVQSQSSGLSANEYLFHATTVYASGGMLLSGDNLTQMPPDKVAILTKLIPPTGKAARFDNEKFDIGTVQLGTETVYTVFNWSDHPDKYIIPLPAGKKYKLTDKWTGEELGIFGKEFSISSLSPHSAMLISAVAQD